MFRVEKGMVLIIVVVEAFDVSGIEEREQRAKISDPTMARAVRLPEMMWKTRTGAELDPSTSISIAKLQMINAYWSFLSPEESPQK